MSQMTQTSPQIPTVQPHADEHHGGGLALLLRLLRAPFAVIGKLVDFIRRKRRLRFKVEEVAVYTMHRSFFLWALILTGFVAAACVRNGGSAVTWGWVYLWVLLYTLLTLLFDISTLKFALWSGIFAFAFVVSKYLEDLKHVHMLSALTAYLVGLRPKLDPGTVSVLSWLLLGPWIGALAHAFGRGRKVFSPNSIEEWYLGEGREITDRAGLKFRSRYRDVFESVLGLGAGDLEAVDGNGVVVKRWENILGLMFVWSRLDEILHQRSAVVDNSPADPVEVEPVRR